MSTSSVSSSAEDPLALDTHRKDRSEASPADDRIGVDDPNSTESLDIWLERIDVIPFAFRLLLQRLPPEPPSS
jgi:hypothetical protein